MDINNTVLKSRYWWFKDVYTPSQIKTINKKINNNFVEAIDRPAPGIHKTANVKIVNSSTIKELDKFFDYIRIANKCNFGFNLFDSLNERDFDFMNYNVYDSKSKGEYKYHIDTEFSHPIFDTKLTAIINLSLHPYEGGEFCINYDGNERIVPELTTPGNMIVFPSFFLHKVTPVTKGKRITASFWVKGPKFI